MFHDFVSKQTFLRGAKEALVVAYDHKEFYHGSDGFNDVVFSDSPDTSRIKGKVRRKKV